MTLNPNSPCVKGIIPQFFNRMHGRPANDPYAGGSADEQPFTDRWDVAAAKRQEYATIVADPPWDLGYSTIGVFGRRARSTEIGYSYMGLDEIAALPVRDLAANDAWLFLWATRKIFREGDAAKVARAWGFDPRGEIIWGHRNAGLGGALGSGHEPVLVARRGSPPALNAKYPLGVYFWRQLYAPSATSSQPGKVHSAKPEGFLDFVEQIAPGPYLEMFSRRARLGWETWGDQSLHGTEAMSA